MIDDALQSNNGFIDDRIILSFEQVCESIYDLGHNTISSRFTQSYLSKAFDCLTLDGRALRSRLEKQLIEESLAVCCSLHA